MLVMDKYTPVVIEKYNWKHVQLPYNTVSIILYILTIIIQLSSVVNIKHWCISGVSESYSCKNDIDTCDALTQRYEMYWSVTILVSW